MTGVARASPLARAAAQRAFARRRAAERTLGPRCDDRALDSRALRRRAALPPALEGIARNWPAGRQSGA